MDLTFRFKRIYQHLTMSTELSATKSKNRIESIDILRGIALLGIALVNVFGFNASFFDFGGFYNNLSDPVQQYFYHIFISLTADKFIFIYSFLFGYGFYLQYQKYGEQGKHFNTYYKRRLFFLALFGVAHVLFLWAGDILLPYAIAGFILYSIRNVSNKILIVFGLFFYFFISFWLVLTLWIPLPTGMYSTCRECLNEALQIYPTGSYLECSSIRLLEYYSFRYNNIFYYFPKILGVFTFGFLASKYKLHQRIQDHNIKWILIFVLVSSIGLIYYFKYESWVYKILPAESNFMDALFMGAYELMNLLIAMGYILLILILASYKSSILKPFAYVGRMSLTNYIMQSALFSIIFYGWGFGKFGMQAPTIFVWYAVGVFIFQLIFSYFWLRHYKQGPLEWLWRKLSYRN